MKKKNNTLLGKIKKIKLDNITTEQDEICILFAEKSVKSSTRVYKNRNQGFKDKNEQDIYIGKVAEYMVYNYFNGKINIELPDTNIYIGNKKTYDADFSVNYKNKDINLHVKSFFNVCRSYPPSWVFSVSDDELVNKRNKSDYLVLCSVRNNQNYAYLIHIDDIIFKPLVLEKFKGIKLCVYEEDVINSMNEKIKETIL